MKIQIITFEGTSKDVYFMDGDEDPNISIILTEEDFDNLHCNEVIGDFEDWEGSKWLTWWNGRNWNSQVIANIEEKECEIIKEYTPDTAFYFQRIVKIDDKEIVLIQPNTGTPFWQKI